MIKKNKEKTPSPSFDTVVPEMKLKLDPVLQQAWELMLTNAEHL